MYVPHRARRIIESKVVDLLSSVRNIVASAALRFVSNIVTVHDTGVSLIVDSGALTPFICLLSHLKLSMKKEATVVCARVAASGPTGIDALIHRAGLFPFLRKNCDESWFDVRRPAVQSIANMLSRGTREQVVYLVETLDVIDVVIETLTVYDSTLKLVALESLKDILQAGHQLNEVANPYAKLLESKGGLDKLEALQQDFCNEVFSTSTELMDTYFNDDEQPHSADDVRQLSVKSAR